MKTGVEMSIESYIYVIIDSSSKALHIRFDFDPY